jgi:hypothetical protein
VTPPYVYSGEVANGNDSDSDPFVDDHDHECMSLQSFGPFPCVAFVAQGFAAQELSLLRNNPNRLVRELPPLQNDLSSSQTCLPLAFAIVPKKISKKRYFVSSAMPIGSNSETSIRSCSDTGSGSPRS